MVLENYYFDFDGKYYHQLSGTAMGTKLAPSHAKILLSSFEDKCVYSYPYQPLLWRGFIDGTFLIWPTAEKVSNFITFLNDVHIPQSNSLIKCHTMMIRFPDILICIKDDTLQTSYIQSQQVSICTWTITQITHPVWKNLLNISNFWGWEDSTLNQNN